MTALLLLWLMFLIALVTLAIGQRRDGGALTLGYFLSMSLLHVPGALVYLSPDADMRGREPTEVGFQITLIGLAAFVAGAVWSRLSAKSVVNIKPTPAVAKILNILGWRMLAIGSIGFFVLLPISTLVPSSTVLVSSLSTALVIGMWLRLYSAAVRSDRHSAGMTLAMLPMLPLATVVTGGFIGYGINWAISVISFQWLISRRRIWFYLGAPVACVLGLSLFVAYMGERALIRDLVWEQKASFSSRFERVGEVFTKLRLIDLSNPTDRYVLEQRLNQNVLVGLGVMRYRRGSVQLAYGSTLKLWAFVPRAIWSDKPAVGGGRSVVTDFTDVKFVEGTSVGAGQVLEFYYNFGLPGLLVGFLALGFTLMRLDIAIMGAFSAGDKRRILLLAMPGLTLLQPGGNLLEIAVATVGALIAAHLILLFERHAQQKRQAKYVTGGPQVGARPDVIERNTQPQRPLR